MINSLAFVRDSSLASAQVRHAAAHLFGGFGRIELLGVELVADPFQVIPP